MSQYIALIAFLVVCCWVSDVVATAKRPIRVYGPWRHTLAFVATYAPLVATGIWAIYAHHP